MIKIEKRELTKEERRGLRNDKISSTIGEIEIFVMTNVMILFIGFIPLLVLRYFFVVPVEVEGWYILFLLISSVLYYLRLRRGMRDENEKPLSEVGVEIISVKTSRAIKRKDPEDFGVAFYLDVIDKENEQRTLFLWGQYLDDLEYKREFPNTEFQIIRRDDTKRLMDIITRGEYFDPEKVLAPFDDELWAAGETPNNGDILQYSIDEVE